MGQATWKQSWRLNKSGQEGVIEYGNYKVGEVKLDAQQYGQANGQSVPLQRWNWKLYTDPRFHLHAASGEASSDEKAGEAALAELRRQLNAHGASGQSN